MLSSSLATVRTHTKVPPLPPAQSFLSSISSTSTSATSTSSSSSSYSASMSTTLPTPSIPALSPISAISPKPASLGMFGSLKFFLASNLVSSSAGSAVLSRFLGKDADELVGALKQALLLHIRDEQICSECLSAVMNATILISVLHESKVIHRIDVWATADAINALVLEAYCALKVAVARDNGKGVEEIPSFDSFHFRKHKRVHSRNPGAHEQGAVAAAAEKEEEEKAVWAAGEGARQGRSGSCWTERGNESFLHSIVQCIQDLHGHFDKTFAAQPDFATLMPSVHVIFSVFADPRFEYNLFFHAEYAGVRKCLATALDMTAQKIIQRRNCKLSKDGAWLQLCSRYCCDKPRLMSRGASFMSSSTCLLHHEDAYQKFVAHPHVLHFLTGEGKNYYPFTNLLKAHEKNAVGSSSAPLAPKPYANVAHKRLFKEIARYKKLYPVEDPTVNKSKDSAKEKAVALMEYKVIKEKAVWIFQTFLASGTVPHLRGALVRRVAATLDACTIDLFKEIEVVCFSYLQDFFTNVFLASREFREYLSLYKLPVELVREVKRRRQAVQEATDLEERRAATKPTLQELDRQNVERFLRKEQKSLEKRREAEKEERERAIYEGKDSPSEGGAADGDGNERNGNVEEVEGEVEDEDEEGPVLGTDVVQGSGDTWDDEMKNIMEEDEKLQKERYERKQQSNANKERDATLPCPPADASPAEAAGPSWASAADRTQRDQFWVGKKEWEDKQRRKAAYLQKQGKRKRRRDRWREEQRKRGVPAVNTDKYDKVFEMEEGGLTVEVRERNLEDLLLSEDSCGSEWTGPDSDEETTEGTQENRPLEASASSVSSALVSSSTSSSS